MFLDHFKMKEQPFGVTPDPHFLFLGESHREALASLYYGIESELGFVALIAPPGLGKTTLTFQLLEKLSSNSRSVFLFQTQCNSRELFQYLLNGLGVETEGMELVSMHIKLNQILCREMLAGRRFILVIDEAQNLDSEVLETIRLLSNFETSRGKMLQILLVGQPQLAQKLAAPDLEQLQQRISVFARLQPLGFDETLRYISHRLRAAGYDGKPLFTSDALRTIAEKSQGIPRKINRLCLSALTLCCAMGRDQVDIRMMEEVIADCDVHSLQPFNAARNVAPLPAISTPAYARPDVFQHLSGTPRSAPSSAGTTRSTVSVPVTARQSLSPHPPSYDGGVGRWVVGTMCLAAFLAVGIGNYVLSSGGGAGIRQESSRAWESIRHAKVSAHAFTGAKIEAATSSSTDGQGANTSDEGPAQSSPEYRDARVSTVAVRAGETLRQIMLRTAGEYTDRTIEQIRTLNPDIANFDQLEAGQTIRVPRVSVPLDSATEGNQSDAGGKN